MFQKGGEKADYKEQKPDTPKIEPPTKKRRKSLNKPALDCEKIFENASP